MAENAGRALARKRLSLGEMSTDRWCDLGLFLVLWLLALVNIVMAFGRAGEGEIIEGFHRFIVGVAMMINAAAILLRAPAIARHEGILPKAIAILGSWMIPPLSMLPITWASDWLLTASSVAITVAYAFVVWAMFTLRNSFSVFPEARELIRHGPYRIVRHPLYTAYIITYVAVLLPRFSAVALLLCMIGIGAEVWRTRYEERILRRAFHDYDSYAAVTPRLFPMPPRHWRTRATP